MAYTITACTLEPMQEDNTTIFAAPYDLQSEVAIFGFGDYMRLTMTLTSSSVNFAVGQRFLFNPCLFAPTANATNFPAGIGWVIEIMSIAGGGAFDVRLATGLAQSDITQQNVKVVVARTAANVLVIELYFYASQDIFDYIRAVPRSNRSTLQTAALGQTTLDNVAQSIWRRGNGFLEFVIYEADANLLPSTVTYSDPYARNPATPFQKHNSYEVSAKFLDNSVGATQTWVGGLLTENSLTELLGTVNGFKFAGQARIGDPQYSNRIDDNFFVVPDEDQLIINAQNDLRIELATPTFTPDYAILRLWRTDDANLLSVQPFVTEYAIKWGKMATDPTAYPNPLSSDDVFSTPAIFTAGSPTILQFKINGNYLAPDARYRIWVGLYDSLNRLTSTHISTPLRTGTSSTPTLTITGNTQLYDYEYPNANDVEISERERFRSAITMQAATYSFSGGAAAFASQLLRVSVEVNDGTSVLASGLYDFTNNQSIGATPVLLSVAGTNYTFAFDYRAPADSAVPVATDLSVVFIPTFRVPNANGSTDLLSIRYAQTIRRRPENTVRIVSLRFLDYSEWLVSNIVPVDTFCTDTNLYVVEAELDAVPLDATLQAYAIFGTPNGTESVFEEESYASAYLPQLTAPQLSGVDITFGVDKLAYFILDISRFPSNAVLTSVAVNAVDF